MRLSPFRIFPSVRFEYFLSLLKNAQYMVGNSSAGVREAPFYGLPSINLGTRQTNRAKANSILNSVEDSQQILTKIRGLKAGTYTPEYEFGDGRSNELFIKALTGEQVWTVCRQKQFVDIG